MLKMNKTLSTLIGSSVLVAGTSVMMLAPAQAASLNYNTWTTNEGDSGNYILTVTESQTAGFFDVELTVNPWNAEALGLFIDWGNFTITDSTIQNITTSPTTGGAITVFATDTTSDSCGAGCNLNGLDNSGLILPQPDGEWEWVLRLANQGFDGIQTFNFQMATNGATLANWGTVAIRAQQLCSGTNTLDNGDAGCGGSDKSFSSTPNHGQPVPEPGTTAALGLFALTSLGLLKKAKKS
jgi:hypothetical protein